MTVRLLLLCALLAGLGAALGCARQRDNSGYQVPAAATKQPTLPPVSPDDQQSAIATAEAIAARSIQVTPPPQTTPVPDLPTETDGNAPGIPTIAGSLASLPNGLKYFDERVGDGLTPSQGDSVNVHYTGWLTNGNKFDSSVDRGTPFSFALGRGQVIRGWDEGVASMRVGGKRRLVIPAELAYGSQGRPSIPPNATLIFDVELVSIAGR
jgi:peptidylprolyl isomerase